MRLDVRAVHLLSAIVALTLLAAASRNRLAFAPATSAQAATAHRVAPQRTRPGGELFTYTGRVNDVELLGRSIWVATSGGLVELDRQTREVVRLHTPLDGLPHPDCTDLAAVEDALWIATPAGLVQMEPEPGRFEVLDSSPVASLHPQPERQVLWALGRDGAVRVDLATGKTRGSRFSRALSPRVFDDELWLPHTGSDRDIALRRLWPLTGRSQDFPEDGPLPVDAYVSGLQCTGDGVWTSVAKRGRYSHSHYTGGGLARIDRRTGETRLFTTDDGLPGNHVHMIQAHGEDLWAVCAEKEWDSYRYSGGGLARYSAGTGEWEQHLNIGGALHGQPTALKEIDGELWVATQEYEDTRWMIVAWGMGPVKRRMPVVKHLSLCRWRDDTEGWEVHRFPAEHSYARITDFDLTGDRIWLRIARTNVAEEPAWRAAKAGGEWLATIPRASGELEWSLRIDRSSAGVGWPSKSATTEVVEDTLWVWNEPELRYFDKDAGTWHTITWPSPLPVAEPEQVAARNGEVWVGTRGGCLARLDPSTHSFRVQSRLQTFGSPLQWAQVQGLTIDEAGALWVTSTAGITTPPVSIYSIVHPDQIPVWRSPNCLLRVENGEVAAPSLAPWSWARRGETGRVSFVPPDEVSTPKRSGTDYSSFGVAGGIYPGEPGVACVLVEDDRVWLASKGDGLYLLQEDEWQRLGPLPPQPLLDAGHEYPECRLEDVVLALARVGDTLCVATSGRLYRFHPSTRTWDALGPKGFRPDYHGLRAAYWDPGILSGYGGSGTGPGRSFLVEFDGDVWMAGGPRQKIRHIRSPLGRLFSFGKPRRIPVLSRHECHLYRLRAGATRVERVPLPFVPACAAAYDGYLWVGTTVGLVRIRPDTGDEAWLTPREGFPLLQSIRGLAADGDALWVASPVGVTRVSLREFGKRSVATRPAG